MSTDDFYASLPKLRSFGDLAAPEAFTPLPRDWCLCCTDIEDSTSLIAAGRYKTVNTIGAAVIAAMGNALDGASFPYVFGGDGAAFAVPEMHAETARRVLAGLRIWAEEEFGIALRVAMLPVAWVRAEGLDVRVARHAVSDHADYAMFSGGGLRWAETQMKQGAFAVPPDPDSLAPDLTGLSCRWSSTPARNGLILSLVVRPGPEAAPDAFAALAAHITTFAAKLHRNGHPVPETGPRLRFPPEGLNLEAHARPRKVPVILRKLALLASSAFAALVIARKKPVGRFDPVHYLSVLSANTDFRKFDDGLKMTLDCTPEVQEKLRLELDAAARAGLVRYGMHAQESVLVTCIVPSVMEDGHVHFVDGAAGGYTQAAANLAAACAQSGDSA